MPMSDEDVLKKWNNMDDAAKGRYIKLLNTHRIGKSAPLSDLQLSLIENYMKPKTNPTVPQPTVPEPTV